MSALGGNLRSAPPVLFISSSRIEPDRSHAIPKPTERSGTPTVDASAKRPRPARLPYDLPTQVRVLRQILRMDPEREAGRGEPALSLRVLSHQSPKGRLALLR